MALTNAYIDELPDGTPSPNDYFVFRDVLGKVTRRVKASQIISNAVDTQDFQWIGEKPYSLNEPVIFQGRWYQSLIDDNIGIVPGTDPSKWLLLNEPPQSVVPITGKFYEKSESLSSDYNLNSDLVQGIYLCSGTQLNLPISNEGFLLLFVSLDNQKRKQLFYPIASENYYIRNYQAGIWSAWTISSSGGGGGGVTDHGLLTGLGDNDHPQYQLISEKGTINGYASLDASGKIPSGQLPSFVDDVLEYANFASFPVTGETGKIYVAINTNLSYRWSGSTYVLISSAPSDASETIKGISEFQTQAEAEAVADATTVPSSHTHAVSNRSLWYWWERAKAIAQNISGVWTFTQSPIAPTPTQGDNSQKVATTEWVNNNTLSVTPEEVEAVPSGQTNILTITKSLDGTQVEIGAAVQQVDNFNSAPSLSTLLADTANWIGDSITLTGDNRIGALGQSAQEYIIDPNSGTIHKCTSHSFGTNALDGSASWIRTRSKDILTVGAIHDNAIIAQLTDEAGWNTDNVKVITVRSIVGSWYIGLTGYFHACIEEVPGASWTWRRIGQPITEPVDIIDAALIAEIKAHNFSNAPILSPASSVKGFDMQRHYWQTGNINNIPSASLLFGNELASGRPGFDLVKDGAVWYGFLTGTIQNMLFRVTFGAGLNSAPTKTENLGSLGGILNAPGQIRIINENGSWFGLIHNTGTGNLVKMSFGSSLINPFTTSILSVGVPHGNGGFGVGRDSSNGWVCVFSKSTLDAGTGITTNQFVIVRLGTTISSPQPSDILTSSTVTAAILGDVDVINISGDWYAFAADFASGKVFKASFGSNLFSIPTVDLISNLPVANLGRIKSAKEGNQIYLFLSALDGVFFKLNFGNDINSTPVVHNEGNVGGVLPQNIYATVVAKEESEWAIFTMSQGTGNVFQVLYADPNLAICINKGNAKWIKIK